MTEQSDDLWGSPTPSISWDVEAPKTVSGVIVSQELVQQVDFDTKKPLVWEDGRPRMKIIVTLLIPETDREGEEDNGERQIHVKRPSLLFLAVQEAKKEAKVKCIEDGDFLSITYTGDRPLTDQEKRQKRSPQKEFAALLRPASEPPF